MKHPAAICLLAMLWLAGCNQLPPPPGNLAVEINDLCTTCVDHIRCDAAGDSAEAGSFSVYVLEQKDFMAQIATIWQYLVQYVNPRQVDRRGVAVHRARLTAAGPRAIGAIDEGRAEQDLVTFQIRLPDGHIDQLSGRWYDSNGRELGSCTVLSRAEGRALLATLHDSAP